MDLSISGLHHVTATVAGAQEDLDFFTGLLGLRLVKKTVNFDNHGVYHFYYGDERGSPSTLMTTFPYGGQGVPVGRKGAGQIVATAFSVPAGALGFWRDRLSEGGVEIEDSGERFGEPFIRVSDSSGLVIELVESEGDDREPWVGRGIEPAAALRGVHSVTLLIRDPEPSLRLVTEILGFREMGSEEEEGEKPRTRHRVGARGGYPIGTGAGDPAGAGAGDPVGTGAGDPVGLAGTFLDIVAAGDAPRAVNGLGTVHHVALAVPDAERQLAAREELVRRGLHVTDVRDRQYFQSIYFREPGGVLYELATLGPGFLIDEDPTDLGRGLKLPSWEESNRPTIEARLPSVSLE